MRETALVSKNDLMADAATQGNKWVTPYPPTNLHEYQRKELQKLHFVKSLILKGAILGCLWLARPKGCPKKEKRAPFGSAQGKQLPESRRGYLQLFVSQGF